MPATLVITFVDLMEIAKGVDHALDIHVWRRDAASTSQRGAASFDKRSGRG